MSVIINTVYLFIIMHALSIGRAQDTSAFPTTDISSPPSTNSELSLDTLILTPNKEERHFINVEFTTCDYAVTPGRTCHSCHQTMTCLRNSMGFVKRCHLFLPYCNNGICSSTPGSLCSAATSSSTSSTSSTSTTTSTTTTSTVAPQQE